MWTAGPVLASTSPGATMTGASPPGAQRLAWGRAAGPQPTAAPAATTAPSWAQTRTGGSPWGAVPAQASGTAPSQPSPAPAAAPSELVRISFLFFSRVAGYAMLGAESGGDQNRASGQPWLV